MGKPMTLEDRIEAAARTEFNSVYGPSIKWENAGELAADYLREAGDVLAAAFPELFGSSPTHWIAPNAPTLEIWSAGIKAINQAQVRDEGDLATAAYDAMRSAYLGEAAHV